MGKGINHEIRHLGAGAEGRELRPAGEAAFGAACAEGAEGEGGVLGAEGAAGAEGTEGALGAEGAAGGVAFKVTRTVSLRRGTAEVFFIGLEFFSSLINVDNRVSVYLN